MGSIMFKKDEISWLVGKENLAKVKKVVDVFYRSDFEFSYKFITTGNKVVSYYYTHETLQVTVNNSPKYFYGPSRELQAKEYINSLLGEK